jgi:hypothetical protein
MSVARQGEGSEEKENQLQHGLDPVVRQEKINWQLAQMEFWRVTVWRTERRTVIDEQPTVGGAGAEINPDEFWRASR